MSSLTSEPSSGSLYAFDKICIDNVQPWGHDD